jgi:hypothetical protein
MRALLCLCLIGLSSACTSSNAPPTPAPNTSPPPPSPLAVAVEPSVSPSANASPDEQQAVDAATRDAAARLNVGITDMTVARVEPRQWPDASLGCPRQGVLYAQIVTPGFLIVLSGAGEELEYHADSRGRVVLCQQ